MFKQLLPKGQQLSADLAAGALTFGHGDQITLQRGPAELGMLHRKMVMERTAIAHHAAAKGLTQKLDGSCGQSAAAGWAAQETRR